MAERLAFISSQPNTRHHIPDSILAYDPRFDIEAYHHLDLKKAKTQSEEHLRLKKQLDTRTRHNLETALGERLNVEISQVVYKIKNGQLQNPDHDEPFVDIVKRGQKYRESTRRALLRETPDHDIERELAEVEGFEKVEQILTNPDFENAKVVVISPRGELNSVYQHNFFDVYEKREDEVTMSRYTSSLSWEEFTKAARQIDPFNKLPPNPKDADFLQNPLVTYQDANQILAEFHPQKDTLTIEEYYKLLEACAPLITSYINSFSSNPENSSLDGRVLQIYNAILNYADKIIVDEENAQDYLSPVPGTIAYVIPAYSIIATYGSQPVRQVSTGCGLQTGFTLVATFPFSVSEFAQSAKTENQDKSDFRCPGKKVDGTPCNYVIRYASGIRKCPECGEEAKCG